MNSLLILYFKKQNQKQNQKQKNKKQKQKSKKQKSNLNPYRSSTIDLLFQVLERLSGKEENEQNQQKNQPGADEILAFELINLLNIISLLQDSTSHFISEDSKLSEEQGNSNSKLNYRLHLISQYMKAFNHFHEVFFIYYFFSF